MKYTPVIVAVILLILLAGAFVYFSPQQQSGVVSEAEVKQLAANFVNTTITGIQITDTHVTGRDGNVWNVTVEYNYYQNGQCNKAKCYWQGPAAQYCRPESSKSLGLC